MTLTDIERERERERERAERTTEQGVLVRQEQREKLQSQQSQLLTEIMQLEQNPTTNQTELDSKRKQLSELQNKEKTITKSLLLETQISLLGREIKELENKPTRT